MKAKAYKKGRKYEYELVKEDIEEILKVKIIEEIPFDKKIPESIANRVPIVLFKPNAKSSVAYKKLAASLIGKEYNHTFLKRLRGFFKRQYLYLGNKDKKYLLICQELFFS